ncbi:HAD family hydrolase [Marinigracilibium pacificum]|uniref:HAD family phosphatase n=1 Tax=Marinigracilibium pacificum TaxID=2729599 RepID=A0A848J4K2_9BACT|nr:HAD family phosphatase [Marinigracilibium pacificum]NMM49279.1 HAD family phosphatase [Marinigracilibium pacificum]
MYQNIIFDLGGVIINLNTDLTYSKLVSYCNSDVDVAKAKIFESKITERYELGEINNEEFREEMREILNHNLSDEELDEAWNAMLLDIPLQRITLLENLRENYSTYLMSNTSPIHLDGVNNILERTNGNKDIGSYFDRSYYSFSMRKRKPNPEVFQQILEENDLIPSETLLFDDLVQNVNSAKQLGIKAILVDGPEVLINFFNNDR